MKRKSKKLISLVVAAIALASFMAPGAAAAETTLKGDVNRDGAVNIKDATIIQKYLAGFTDAEKKEFLNSFIERVDIYEQEQPDGRFLKHIKFRFPVFFDGKETEELSWDSETTLETVVLISKE